MLEWKEPAVLPLEVAGQRVAKALEAIAEDGAKIRASLTSPLAGTAPAAIIFEVLELAPDYAREYARFPRLEEVAAAVHQLGDPGSGWALLFRCGGPEANASGLLPADVLPGLSLVRMRIQPAAQAAFGGRTR